MSYPQYPQAGGKMYPPPSHQPYPSYPGGGSVSGYPGAPRTPAPSYPGLNVSHSTPPTGMMSTSFTTLPSHYGSKPDVHTSRANLLPVVNKEAVHTDYVHPVVATVLCPLIGLFSLYNTHRARQALKDGNKPRARYYIVRSNTQYGYAMCIGIALWLALLALVFVIFTHYLISFRHYSVSLPGQFVNGQ